MDTALSAEYSSHCGCINSVIGRPMQWGRGCACMSVCTYCMGDLCLLLLYVVQQIYPILQQLPDSWAAVTWDADGFYAKPFYDRSHVLSSAAHSLGS